MNRWVGESATYEAFVCSIEFLANSKMRRFVPWRRQRWRCRKYLVTSQEAALGTVHKLYKLKQCVGRKRNKEEEAPSHLGEGRSAFTRKSEHLEIQTKSHPTRWHEWREFLLKKSENIRILANFDQNMISLMKQILNLQKASHWWSSRITLLFIKIGANELENLKYAWDFP